MADLWKFIAYSLYSRIANDNVEVLTKIGIMYLKINETQRAFDKLTEANHLNGGNSTETLVALGAILQVILGYIIVKNKYPHITK
jgi:Bardet-Biedl syndrome 4 protein